MFNSYKEIILSSNEIQELSQQDKELLYAKNFALDNISKDIDKFQFNTAIARLMEYTNAISDYLKVNVINRDLLKDCMETYVIMLAPFAPHMAEELWEYIGHTSSVFNEKWPQVDAKALIKDDLNITVQVNGKVKLNFLINKDAKQDDITEKAVSLAEKYLRNKKIVKTIYVKNKLVNIVAMDM